MEDGTLIKDGDKTGLEMLFEIAYSMDADATALIMLADVLAADSSSPDDAIGRAANLAACISERLKADSDTLAGFVRSIKRMLNADQKQTGTPSL